MPMLSNFKPEILVKPEHRNLVVDYFRYLELGLSHYAKENVSAEMKKQKLELLEKALRKDFPLENSLILSLQKEFLNNNLSLYLLLDPIYAWRYLASGKLPTSEVQLSEFVNLFISSAARLILALYDENPATYLPLSALFSALFLIDVFQKKSALTAAIKISKRQKLSKLKGLIKNAQIILSLVKSKRLKFKLAVAVNYAKITLTKYQNNEQAQTGIVDNTAIILYSTWQFISVKHKTLEKMKV